MSNEYVLRFKNKKFNCGVIVVCLEEGNQFIRETPMNLKKFKGEDVESFKKWMATKFPETVFERIEMPAQEEDPLPELKHEFDFQERS